MLISSKKLTPYRLSQLGFKLQKVRISDRSDNDIDMSSLDDIIQGKAQYVNTDYTKPMDYKDNPGKIHLAISYQTKRVFIRFKGYNIPLPNYLIDMIQEGLFEKHDLENSR